jgi:hypothetical protein
VSALNAALALAEVWMMPSRPAAIFNRRAGLRFDQSLEVQAAIAKVRLGSACARGKVRSARPGRARHACRVRRLATA